MTDKPVREHDKFMLRLPDGMRDRLKDEAAKNKRSLNAEIIERLELSLAPPVQLQFKIKEELGQDANLLFEALAKQSADMIGRLQKRIAELEATQTAPGDQKMGHISVTLDANGNPISWDEIREHLKAIRQAGDFDVWSMIATVQNAEIESSGVRQEATRKVADFYRRQKRSAPKP